jgi:hypothetical protein
MITNVPQYIDVEDKIAGPLTAKQLLWMIGLGALLFVLWMFIPNKGIFFIVAIPFALFFIALAFYKPFGQPLVGFVGNGFLFLFSPKVYIWRRLPQQIKNVSHKNDTQKENASIQGKSLTPQQLSALAHVLDSEGAVQDEEALELIHEREIRMAQKKNAGFFPFPAQSVQGSPRNERNIGLQEDFAKPNSSASQASQRRNFGDFLEM